MNRWLRRGGYAVAALAVVGLLPPVQARLKAAPVLAEAIGLDVPRPLARRVERTQAVVGGVSGDLYTVGSAAPGIVLVHGAALEGKDDPRLVRAASSIAAAGRTIFVPELALARRELEERDIERIVDATLGLAERDEVTGAPILVGISYGGSFALIAAADERLRGRVPLTATFGAYYDLTGVVQAVTTGVSLVDGRRVPYDAHPRAEEVLTEVAVRLAPREARAGLRRALAGELPPSRLPRAARAVYELVTNDDPQRTYELARRLPEKARETLRTFSPSTVAESIESPVLALHSTGDPAVPYGEALRLGAGLPRARVYSVSLFEHVDLATGERKGGLLGLVGDVVTTWRFTGDVLSAQE